MPYLYEIVVRINKFKYNNIVANTNLDTVHNTFMGLDLVHDTFHIFQCITP
jgi:hypothetical protein